MKGQKLAPIRLFFTCDPRNREVFELQTVMQSVREFARSLLTGCTGKKSSGPVAFILCGPCKEHSEKEVNRKNNEGKGYGVRVVRTPSGSFRYTSLRTADVSPRLSPLRHVSRKVPQRRLARRNVCRSQATGIPDSGKPYEWFILTALVNSLLPYGNAK